MTVKILFMGRKRVSAEALKWLSLRDDVEIVGVLTDSHLTVSPTLAMANELGLSVFSFEDALAQMKSGELEFDLGISLLFWRKLKEEFLTVPTLGVVNFHPAPLPEYKGTAGYNLAILEGRTNWACSAHYVDEQIDTGEIISVTEFAIDSAAETAQTLEAKSSVHLLNLFKDVVTKIVESRSKLDTRPNIGGTYTSRAEMERMKKIEKGDDIERKVRAFWFPPYDGAYIELEGERYTLVSQKLLQLIAPEGSSSLFSSPSQK